MLSGCLQFAVFVIVFLVLAVFIRALYLSVAETPDMPAQEGSNPARASQPTWTVAEEVCTVSHGMDEEHTVPADGFMHLVKEERTAPAEDFTHNLDDVPSASAETFASRMESPSPLEGAWLVELSTGRRVPVHRTVSIGHGAHFDISLPEARDSGNRAKVCWDRARGEGSIQDLGSRGGTSVNGIPVMEFERVSLHEGDEIRIGSHRYEWRQAVRRGEEVFDAPLRAF